MDDQADFRPLRVVEAQRIAQEIFRFTLEDPDGAELPEFTAGAHLSLRVPNGLVRRYSLCGDPLDRQRYSIAVKREARGEGGSLSLCDGTFLGETLMTGPPVNDFPLSGRPAGRIFIAGGIGITPIMAMIHHLQAEDGPPWKLWYLTRSPEHTAFHDDLRAPELAGRVVIHHDGGDPDRALDLWPVLEHPKGRHVHCCGPRGLMQAVRDMTGHWPASSVHFEDFGGPAAQARPADQAFSIRLARAGRSLEVPPGTSILSTLHAAGIAVAFSCEGGSCGSCRTALLGGVAEHRDLVLMEHERATQIMVCVSRAAPGEAELVLDL